MEDALFEIALRSKIRTIVNLMRVLPTLNNIYFWKLKCLRDYPINTYLDCWTGPENYLVGNSKFCFNAYLNDKNIIHHLDIYLYEYTPLLKFTLYPTVAYKKNYERLEIATVRYIKQYVLLSDEVDHFNSDCYHSEKETMIALKQMTSHAIVINLAHRSPCFIKYGVLKERTGVPDKYYQYLNGKIKLKPITY